MDFFFFFENIISGIQLFYIRSNAHVVIRVFFVSDFVAESLKANKTSKKDHSFYNTVSLKKPHDFTVISLMELAQKALQPGQKSYRAHIWHRSPT